MQLFFAHGALGRGQQHAQRGSLALGQGQQLAVQVLQALARPKGSIVSWLSR